MLRPPNSTLFPYTTLFRSGNLAQQRCVELVAEAQRLGRHHDGLRRLRPLLRLDRKSTRLNSSHLGISYAVFCLKKKIFGISLIISNFLIASSINEITCLIS